MAKVPQVFPHTETRIFSMNMYRFEPKVSDLSQLQRVLHCVGHGKRSVAINVCYVLGLSVDQTVYRLRSTWSSSWSCEFVPIELGYDWVALRPWFVGRRNFLFKPLKSSHALNLSDASPRSNNGLQHCCDIAHHLSNGAHILFAISK